MVNQLIEKIKEYNPKTDEDLIIKAYEYAKKAHKGQKRKSGEEYIIHPVHVALILTELEVDDQTICAALMHDVLEDTDISYEEMEEEFGKEITELVNGVTKLKNINFKSKTEGQSENIRKMILATSKDIRVIIIKLADRLHNMRTLEYMTRESQIRKARETMEIYVPFAHRLGINKIKSELEDLCFKFLDPNSYYEIEELVNKKSAEREEYIEKIIKKLSLKLDELGINHDISGRPKSLYSTYQKMISQNKSFEEIYDLMAIRVIVDTVKDCYSVLGQVHSMWTMMNNRFKDYISVPKPNLYQSLHTTVFADDGEIIEVQIRTWDMHRVAEFGIAAHWQYKEGKTKIDDFDKKVSWIRSLIEVGNETEDSQEYLETLKGDYFSDEVYVYTPNGDLLDLPKGSTPLDFAYLIHSEVGNSCVGAKVNSRIVPLDYQLVSGDVVEILTSKNSQGPSRDWLNNVKTSQAKQKIRQWFKKEKKHENIEYGRDILEKEIKKEGYNVEDLLRDEWINEIAKDRSYNKLDDLYAAIGFGTIQSSSIISSLKDKYRKAIIKEEKEIESNDTSNEMVSDRNNRPKSITVMGDDSDFEMRLAKCCNPVLGDKIVGFITRGHGISIHRANCENVLNNKHPERLIAVDWNTEEAESQDYLVKIMIIAFDKKGYLNDVTELVSQLGLNIAGVSAYKNKNMTYSIELVLEMKSIDEVESVIKKIKGMPDTLEVFRA